MLYHNDPLVVAGEVLFSQVETLLATYFPGFWSTLSGASLFITGGTGFVGRWLLECLARAENRYRLGMHVMVLTRDRSVFARTYLGAKVLLEHPSIDFIEGDVRYFGYPDRSFTHIIHAAHASAYATFNNYEDPLIQFDIAFGGARRVLDLALYSGVQRFLMLSSGSVYGAISSETSYITENFAAAPLPQDVGAALNHGKRAAEFLCACYRQKHDLEIVVARCFTLVGPGLPLDIHYAIGNFIRDALWNDAIIVNGDGSPIRSYMYIADLVVWLLVMLTQASSGGVFNVGSDEPISIYKLACRIRDILAPDKSVLKLYQINSSANRNIYLPNITFARDTLHLDVWTDLSTAIRYTGDWSRRVGRSVCP